MKWPPRRILAAATSVALVWPRIAYAADPAASRTQPGLVLQESSEDPISGAVVAPAYRVVEGISDGVFDFMRAHVIGTLLPPQLSRDLKAAPQDESTPLFGRNISENEARYLDRANAAYPVTVAERPANSAELRSWSSWAAREQADVVVQSFEATLISRYQLELFGHSSGDYAKDPRNWDPGFITMAGLLGGAFLYLNGFHASVDLGPARVGLDLAPGLKYRQVLQGDGTGHRLASVEVGVKDTPFSVAAEWGVLAGHLRQERVGLSYRLRF